MADPAKPKGLISVRSSAPLANTIECLLIALERRGMVIHSIINYAKEAAEAELNLRPAYLFIFGYPEAEAPLIIKDQLLGIDFPQKMLVWQDAEGAVWISYNDPFWVGERHSAPDNMKPLFAAIRNSLLGIAADAKGVVPGP